MTTKLIIASDPGKATGVAMYDLDARVLYSWEMTWLQYAAWLDTTLQSWGPAATQILVACERFVITAGTIRTGRGDENWSIEAIGASRYLCSKYGAQFELKSAGDSKKFSPNERLKQAGWYHRSSGHARDAARVAVLAAADIGIVPPWV